MSSPATMNPSPKKRVRFNDTPEYAPAKEEGELAGQGGASKRSKIDPMEALEGEIMGTLCLAEGADAAACAASRRAARRRHLMEGFDDEEGVEGAEADYEDPEEMFNDAGVPFEPFHLKREREEGYFDEAGNYVEYKTDEVEDAWADELANVEVDEEWLARVMAGPGRHTADALAAGEQPDMAPDQIAAQKRKLVDLLLPGENVLQALRRLAAVRQPAAGAADGRASPTAADPLARHPRALAGQGPMPPVVRDKFEQLTGLSSLLMEQGIYGVHSMSREALERSMLREELAEQQSQQSQQAQQGQQGPPGPTAQDTQQQSREEGGPQAEQLNGQSPAKAAGEGGGSGGEAAGAGQALAERLLAAAAPAASNGQNGSAANGHSGGGAAAPAAPAPVDADQDIFAEEEAPAAAAAPPAPENAAAPADDGARGQLPAQQHQPAKGEPAALEPAGVERDGSGDVAMQDSQQPAAQAAAAPAGQPEAAAGAAQPHAGAAAAPVTEGAQQPQQQPQQQPPAELEGFTQDPDSGWLYNSALGMYYDPERQLFGEAASGHWYSYDAASGQYTLAS
ncbi:hypothetical protein ABPG75_009732 [Micractinium tetrahymenae]